MPVYNNRWSCAEDMMEAFQADIKELDGCKVLYADYTYEDYNGDCFVLYINYKDGELYEVNGSHCSCYELEGQWCPEVTSKEALLKRKFIGNIKSIIDELVL